MPDETTDETTDTSGELADTHVVSHGFGARVHGTLGAMRSWFVIGLVSASAHLAGAAPSVAVGKVRIDLKVRKPAHFLGENVLVDFCVVNTDTKQVVLEVGGDYRGSSRSLRFKLDVRDAQGKQLPDPDPSPFNMGGIGYSPTIAPGKHWCQSLQLARYARIDGAGKYTIKATHDLGWPANTAPAGKVVVTFAMPTAAQAEQVVKQMEALPDDPSTSAGDVDVAFADFSALRYEIYVAPLVARAEQGNERALAGLSEIPTAAATTAIVALLHNPNVKIARAAAGALAMRLPDPALTGQLGKRNPFEDARSEQRKYLAKAWVPALADEVRAIARQRLASPELRDQHDGAFMLEAVGVVADAPDLIKAIDRAIDITLKVPAEVGIYPVPRGALMELLRATEILVGRGLAPAAPRTRGELAVWLVALSKGARPAGWETELGAAMKHAVPYLRQLALERCPDAVPPALVPAVALDLANADPDVQVAAAELAQRAKLVALTPNVVKAMAKVTGLRLNIISSAAYLLGAREDRIAMLLVRLTEKDAFDEALGELVDLLAYEGRGSNGIPTDAQRAAVVPHWKKFVAAHRADIRADKKIPLTDPSVTPALIPPTWNLGKPGGKGDWP